LPALSEEGEDFGHQNTELIAPKKLFIDAGQLKSESLI